MVGVSVSTVICHQPALSTIVTTYASCGNQVGDTLPISQHYGNMQLTFNLVKYCNVTCKRQHIYQNIAGKHCDVWLDIKVVMNTNTAAI